MRDRHAHVGRAELRQHRAVDIFDHRMDHRLRMDDDLDPRRARPGTGRAASISSSPLFISVAESTEILAPIDQLGCATACSGVTPRISLERPVAERPAARGQDDPADALGPRRGRSIGRSHYARNRRAAASRRCARPRRSITLAGRDQRLLVGEHDGAALLDRRHHRLAARRSRRSPPSSSRRRMRAASNTACAPARRLDAGAGERVAQRRQAGFVGDHRQLGVACGSPPRRARRRRNWRSARRPGSRSGSRSIRSSVERADRAGRAEDGDGLHSSPTARAARRPATPPTGATGTGRRAGRARRHGRAGALPLSFTPARRFSQLSNRSPPCASTASNGVAEHSGSGRP